MKTEPLPTQSSNNWISNNKKFNSENWDFYWFFDNKTQHSSTNALYLNFDYIRTSNDRQWKHIQPKRMVIQMFTILKSSDFRLAFSITLGRDRLIQLELEGPQYSHAFVWIGTPQGQWCPHLQSWFPKTPMPFERKKEDYLLKQKNKQTNMVNLHSLNNRADQRKFQCSPRI